MARAVAALALAAGAGARAGDVPERARVALLPSRSPEVTEALVSGARLALEQARRSGGPDLELVVGELATGWASAASEAARLLEDPGLVAFVTPPERDVAHLLAQVGTKAHVPVVSTSSAASVTATGSFWIRAVAEAAPERERPGGGAPPATAGAPLPGGSGSPAEEAFVAAYRERYGRVPSAEAAAGYDAARVLVEGARTGGPGRAGMLEGLAAGRPVAGARGPIVFDRSGRRLAGR